jgi:hypothetical protein
MGVMIRFWFLIFVLVCSSCAQIKTLDGGQKDVQPPVLLSATLENETRNFKENTVSFVFNEFIALNDVQGQLIFSPQLKTFPEVQIKGKMLIMAWKDTLLNNTTYQFDFGNAVVDNTEGNPVSVSRVFSTGSIIDSLMICGKVMDAWTQEKPKDVLVQLVKELPLMGQDYQPMYQVKTKEGGLFQFNHLSSNPYFVISFKDSNSNGRWDDKEEMDWTEDAVWPKVTPDTLNMIQAKSLVKQNGFLDIHVDSCGWMSTFWDHRWAPAKVQSRTNQKFSVQYEEDSLLVLLEEPEQDGYFTFLISDTTFQDSVNIPFFTEAMTNRNLKIPIGQRVSNKDSMEVQLPISATGWDEKRWKWLVSDTVYSVNAHWHKEQKKLSLTVPKKGFFGEAELLILKGGVYSGDRNFGNDTTQVTVEWLSEEQSGFFQVQAVPETWRNHHWSLQDAKKVRLYDLENLEKGLVLVPGKYHLQVWEDANHNEVWDGHDYSQGKKAESVIYRSKEINVRANWQEVLKLSE